MVSKVDQPSFAHGVLGGLGLALMVACSCPLRAQSAPTLNLVAQSLPNALLVDVNDQGELLFQTPQRQLSAKADQIVHWRRAKSIAPTSSVALLDGSWLSGRLEWLSPQSLRIRNDWFETPIIPLDQVRAILLQPSPSLSETIQLQRQLLEPTGAADVVWKTQGEPARGVLVGEIKEPLISGGAIRIAWSLALRAGEASVSLAETSMVGLTFSPILRPPLTEVTTLVDASTLALSDGSRLQVRSLRRRTDDRVELQLANSTLVSLDSAPEFVLGIVDIAAHNPTTTWLSDLEPARYRLLDSDSRIAWPLGRNRDLFGQRLFDRDLPIDKALVVHAPAQVAYRWDGRAGKLLSQLSLWSDATLGGLPPRPGAARLQVLAARNGQLESVYQSDILRYDSTPLDMEVDISGAQLIALVAESAEGGPWGNHLLLRDARIAIGP